MKVLLIEPGKVPKVIDLDSSLESMQKAVGGLIQAVYPFRDSVALICNEEGKLLGLPLNRRLRDENGTIYDIISGTFFLCQAPPDGERFASLTDEQIDHYKKLYQTPELFMKINGQIICLPMEAPLL